MDGKRIQNYWSSEIEALVKTYQQFATLIPSPRADGAAHNGEDGRFVEDLIRESLKRFLPHGLEVLTGFIVRPAVKTGVTGAERKLNQDRHSTQLDIIIFDSANYPIFQRFGNSAIVPPEGVVAILSVKKHLNQGDIQSECKALLDAASLCEELNSNDGPKMRGPYLALVAVKSKIKVKKDNLRSLFKKIDSAYAENPELTFDKLIGFIGVLDEWSIFKKRPAKQLQKAEYIWFKHQTQESHLGLQFLLTGILSVFYDPTRRNLGRPGYTAFESGRSSDKNLGSIPCTRLR